MSVARFIADQRTFSRVSYASCCAILGVSLSWLHKWLDRPVTPRHRRGGALDATVRELFEAFGRTLEYEGFFGTTSRPGPKRVSWCWPGATTSTALDADTAQPHCYRRPTWRRSPLTNRQRHNRTLHDSGGARA